MSREYQRPSKNNKILLVFMTFLVFPAKSEVLRNIKFKILMFTSDNEIFNPFLNDLCRQPIIPLGINFSMTY